MERAKVAIWPVRSNLVSVAVKQHIASRDCITGRGVFATPRTLCSQVRCRQQATLFPSS